MYIQYIFVKDLFLIEGTEERIFIPHVLCLSSELFSRVWVFISEEFSMKQMKSDGFCLNFRTIYVSVERQKKTKKKLSKFYTLICFPKFPTLQRLILS